MALNLDHQRDRISTASGNITISTSGALRVPVGNTAQRPQGGVVQTGQIRFNTQTTQYEGYNGVSWTSLGGVKDVDQDTYITAEQVTDDDTLRFYTAGVERMIVNNLGEIEIYGNTSLTQDLRVDGATTLDTLDVNSQATIASLNIEDLTQYSILLAGLNGEIEDNTNFTFDGTNMEIGTTGALGLPSGTQAQRPGTPDVGYIRFSTDASNLEFWDGSSWNVVGTGAGAASAFTTISVSGQNNVIADGPSDTLTIAAGTGMTITTDAATDTITFAIQSISAGTLLTDGDGDTKINLETTPDEDTIRFTTDGTERMVIDNTGLVSILGTSALEIPAGTTAERPTTLAQGQIRYNTTDSTFEGYDGAAWGSLGGVKDVDQDTYITAEQTADDDTLRFYTAGNIALTIDSIQNAKFESIGAVRVPVGSEADKTSFTAEQGQIRYNTTDSTFEGYDGAAWGSLGGVKDVDQDTYIEAEETADDDTLRFYTAGVKRVEISSTGETIINSATVSDLTDTRVVYAGTNGELQDSSNLTFRPIGGTSTVTGSQTNPTITSGDEFSINGTTVTLTGTSTLTGSQTNPTVTANDQLSINTVQVTLTGTAVVTGTTATPTVTAADEFSINGTTITLTGTDLASVISDITTAAISGISAANNGSDQLQITGTNVNVVLADVTNTPLADLGLTAGTTTATGNLTSVISDITNASIPNVTATNVANQLVLTGANVSLVIADVTNTPLADLGLTAGTTTATGDITSIVSDITSASVANVTASNNSNQLQLVGNDIDITLADVTNTPLASIGLTAGTTPKTGGTDTLTVGGNVQIDGTLTVDGIATLKAGTSGTINMGDDATDNVVFNADINSNLNPDVDATYDLGSTLQNWRTAHVQTLDSNTETITVDVTGGLVLPVGTTGERSGTPAQGTIRYNTTDTTFEGYDGSNWGSLGGVKDVDQDTYIEAEQTADDDTLRFYTAGSERATISSTGVLSIGDSAGSTFYSFPTARGTNNQILSLDANGILSFINPPAAAGFYYQDAAPTTGISTADLWFDTGTTGELYVYTGLEWISTTPGADTGFIKQNYTGDGTTTAYDTQTGVNGGTVSLVFVNGVLVQPTNDYNEVGGVVTFVSAPLNGDQIDIMITGSLVTLALNPLGLNNHNLITVDASGNVEVSSLSVADLTDNRVVIAGTLGELEDDANFTFDGTNLVVSTTGSIQLPVGTTAQRPTAIQGQIRYNTDDGNFEGYNGTTWNSLDTSYSDSDVDTHLNQSTATNNTVLGWNGSDYAWVAQTSGYSDASVDAHLNTSTATSNQILSWTGSDYAWVADSDVSGIALTDLSVGADAAASGSGGIAYNNSNGVFTYTPPDLSSYITTEQNDLTLAVSWADVPDANITQSSVIQHQAALSITQSQITDLAHYTDASVDTHLNTGTASSGQILSWNGSDYAWVADQTGSGSITLNTAGDSGTGTVDLSTQTLSVAGTTNEIQTSVSNQTVTVGLPTDVTVQGNLTVDTNTLYVDATNNRVGIGTITPSETLHVDGAIRVDGVSTLKTSTTTVSSTSATTIDTFDGTVDRSSKYIIQATNTVTEEYQIAEAVCIHDGTTAYISIYGIIYTGSAEITTYSANYSATEEFELQATGATANSIEYKVTRVNTLV